MCDIWKNNHRSKQLTKDDISSLLDALRKLGTRQVVMSGGEALLNPDFFRLCALLRQEDIWITLLSTGLTLKKHADQVVQWVHDVIVSLDGDEALHDEIRNIPGAFHKLREGITEIRRIRPAYPITGRTVIHRLNFRSWPSIVDAGLSLGLNQISFLPADVSSHAFNREVLWSDKRQHEILLSREELPELQSVINDLVQTRSACFQSRFIAEAPLKLQKIYLHYAAWHGLNPFPDKKCNAPWVSAVIEADGAVRPCFFHEALGNIHADGLDTILNSSNAVRFRQNLDVETNATCRKCVCYLNLPPGTAPVAGF